MFSLKQVFILLYSFTSSIFIENGKSQVTCEPACQTLQFKIFTDTDFTPQSDTILFNKSKYKLAYMLLPDVSFAVQPLRRRSRCSLRLNRLFVFCFFLQLIFYLNSSCTRDSDFFLLFPSSLSFLFIPPLIPYTQQKAGGHKEIFTRVETYSTVAGRLIFASVRAASGEFESNRIFPLTLYTITP